MGSQLPGPRSARAAASRLVRSSRHPRPSSNKAGKIGVRVSLSFFFATSVLAGWTLEAITNPIPGAGPGTAIIFGLSCLIVATAGILALVAARVEVRIEGDMGRISTGVGPLSFRKAFTPSAVTGVRVEDTGKRSHWTLGKRILLEGPPLVRFGSWIPNVRRRYVAAVLGRLLTHDTGHDAAKAMRSSPSYPQPSHDQPTPTAY